MSEMKHGFSVGAKARLEVRLAAGVVRVLEGAQGRVDVTVSGRDPSEVVVEQSGDTVLVRQEASRRSGEFEVTATVPSGTDLDANLASADLEVRVPVGDLRIALASGDIRAGNVEREASVKSASGDVEIARVGGAARVATASGDVEIGEVAGEFRCDTASGDIRLREVGGNAGIHTASGDARIERFLGRELTCRTVSGDFDVRIPRGRRVDVDVQTLSGDVKLPSEPTATPAPAGDRPVVRVEFHSLSGDFRLEEAG